MLKTTRFGQSSQCLSLHSVSYSCCCRQLVLQTVAFSQFLDSADDVRDVFFVLFSVHMFDSLTISIADYLNDEALTNIFIYQIT